MSSSAVELYKVLSLVIYLAYLASPNPFTACGDKNHFLLIEAGIQQGDRRQTLGIGRPAGFQCYLSSWGSTRRLQHTSIKHTRFLFPSQANVRDVLML